MKSATTRKPRRPKVRAVSSDMVTALVRAKLISSDSKPLATTDMSMIHAAGILRRAGLTATTIPPILRKLSRLLAGSANQVPSQSASRQSVGVESRRPTGRVLIDIRSSTGGGSAQNASVAYKMERAAAHFERGLALEDSDEAAAREAYAQALATHSDHLDARINLGRLMHLAGELPAAEEVYRAAKQTSALLAFNLALLLEDSGRDDDAVQAYREALAMDPTMHEAHLNLSLLHERQNRPRDALRHMLAFRRTDPF